MGVDDLSMQAVKILKAAKSDRETNGLPFDRGTLAMLYDTEQVIVANALYRPGFQMGTLSARKIIRAHIAHLQAEQRGERLSRLSPKDKYKGTREF